MNFLKLLNIGLILVTKMVFCIDDNLKVIHRLPNNTIPIHYDINLALHFEKDNFTFYGDSNINIEIRYTSLNISLHSRELKLNETATMLISDEGTVYKPMKHICDNVTNILTLNFKNGLSPGFYVLNIKFIGIVSEIGSVKNGFMKFSYVTEKGNSSWLAATHFVPNGARGMFPCWDEPALKATFSISIIHHQKYEISSNMPMIRKQFLEQDGMIQTHFNITPIMSTYLVAIVVLPTSDFVHVFNANKTINIWCSSSLTSQIKFMHSIPEQIVPLLIEYTNSSKKIPKTDHVLVSNFPVGAMENWGLIIYNDFAGVYDDIKHPIYKKTRIASVVTHEITHEWFGNLVTPTWWSYQWLKEGLAMFFQTYILEKVFKNIQMDFMMMEFFSTCFIKDIGSMKSVTLNLKDTDDLFEFILEVYCKAPILIRMLHNTITTEVFRNGIIKYLATHQFSSASPNDLWNAMQSALDESDISHKDYRIKEVMDTWMNQDRYPVVNVVKNYETGEVTISQTCVRKLNETANELTNKWWIPVTFATQSNPDFSNTVAKYWLRPDQNNISFVINPNDWIIVNLQLTGYYRVNYDIRNWYKISNYLHSQKYNNIHVLNRVQIISDSFAVMMEENKEMSGFLFVNLISYLSIETNYVPWYPMFVIIAHLKKPLLLPEMNNVKMRLVELLDRLFLNVGYEENRYDDDMTVLTRNNALKWACKLGHEKCKAMAAIKLNKHLANPNTYKIPSWQKLIYCTGLMTANQTTWNKALKLYRKKYLRKKQTENELDESKREKSLKLSLKSLSCAENPDIIINYLNITAFNTSEFDDKERSLVLMYIIEKHSRIDWILDYILKNFEIIKPKSLTATVIITSILSNIYSNEQIDKVQRYLETNVNNDPDTLDKLQNAIKMRKDFLKQLADTFKRRFYSRHPPYDAIDRDGSN